MRAIIQRVSSAEVRINQQSFAAIGKGLLILLGVGEEDSDEDRIWLSEKISKLRIFADGESLMNLSVKDIDGECLVVSQFTLYAKTKKGNRPSFTSAANPDIAKKAFDEFCNSLDQLTGKIVKRGRFGADMEVSLVNDGPVTIIIDTQNKE